MHTATAETWDWNFEIELSREWWRVDAGAMPDGSYRYAQLGPLVLGYEATGRNFDPVAWSIARPLTMGAAVTEACAALRVPLALASSLAGLLLRFTRHGRREAVTRE